MWAITWRKVDGCCGMRAHMPRRQSFLTARRSALTQSQGPIVCIPLGRGEVAAAICDESCAWEPRADPAASSGLQRTRGASLSVRTPFRAVAFPLGCCPRLATPASVVSPDTGSLGLQVLRQSSAWSPGTRWTASSAPGRQVTPVPSQCPPPRPKASRRSSAWTGAGRPLLSSLVLSLHEARVRLTMQLLFLQR